MLLYCDRSCVSLLLMSASHQLWTLHRPSCWTCGVNTTRRWPTSKSPPRVCTFSVVSPDRQTFPNVGVYDPCGLLPGAHGIAGEPRSLPLFFYLHKLMSSVQLRNAIVKAGSESDSATNAGRWERSVFAFTGSWALTALKKNCSI